MQYLMRCLSMGCVMFLSWVPTVLAQATSAGDPQAVVEDYSTQMISILKGPIAKVLSFVILLVCVGALLRGRHKIAVSCGVAFIVLLFVQVI